MHMKKATNITLATLAAALLASSCIKEADPYEIATEDQVTLVCQRKCRFCFLIR